MAETQDASLGYGGEFWLHNGTALYQLVQVAEFDVPEGGTREQVDKTHLQSANLSWHREFLSAFYEDSDFEVVLHYRPLSTTDSLVREAIADADVRAFLAVIPEDGVPVAQVEGTAKCMGRSKPRVTPDGLMQTTATFRIVTVDEPVAYVTPTP